MLDFPRWKTWLVIVSTAFGLILAIPSLMTAAQRAAVLPDWIAKVHINLGLDLSGGSQLLLEADVADVKKQQIDQMEDVVRDVLRKAEPKIEISDIATSDGKLAFMVRDAKLLDTAVDLLNKQTAGVALTGQKDWTIRIEDSTRIVMQPTDAGTTARIAEQIDTARNVVAKRIDPDGTKEVTVVKQGADRILVQVPGLQDPEQLKRLLGKTAKLEFKAVDLTADPAEVAQGHAPIGSIIVPTSEGGKIALKRKAVVSGEDLNSARQDFDENGAVIVSLSFNSQGGKKFGRWTVDNVGKPFAIVLDDIVLQSPNIREPILGGNAQISGGFTVDSANELAITLRSGKLPVALRVMDQRSVGPELGQDSIRSGVIAGVVATIALIFFMVITYARFGVYTTLALLVNALLILGLMGLFSATLTLPGIAGFVLTIGAAVDANVLINERIREEVRRGRQTIQAVEVGYKEASRAIFDANVTNVISAIIMFWFGSGPVRGFAVVLALGIVTSVFTGVTFTRLLVADYLKRKRPRELNI
jgi:preprotein translocase subunit SecD